MQEKKKHSVLVCCCIPSQMESAAHGSAGSLLPLESLQAACSICSFIGYVSAVAVFSGGTVAMQTPIYMKAKQWHKNEVVLL